jgi:hypothetical protein
MARQRSVRVQNEGDVEGIKTEDGGLSETCKGRQMVTPALLFRQANVSGIQSILQRTKVLHDITVLRVQR